MTAIATRSLSTPGLSPAAISTRGLVARATGFDRALLFAASALDTFVIRHVQRRAGADYRRASAAQAAAAQTREAAQALGAVGILPR